MREQRGNRSWNKPIRSPSGVEIIVSGAGEIVVPVVMAAAMTTSMDAMASSKGWRTYSLSRGAPSATWVLLQAVDFYLTCCYRFLCSGEGGIRTHGGTTHTGFQDRHHKPLGHLSVLHALVTCLIILTLFSQSVNTNFKLFSIFFCLFFAP